MTDRPKQFCDDSISLQVVLAILRGSVEPLPSAVIKYRAKYVLGPITTVPAVLRQLCTTGLARRSKRGHYAAVTQQKTSEGRIPPELRPCAGEWWNTLSGKPCFIINADEFGRRFDYARFNGVNAVTGLIGAGDIRCLGRIQPPWKEQQ